jgi:hypothetical protein
MAALYDVYMFKKTDSKYNKRMKKLTRLETQQTHLEPCTADCLCNGNGGGGGG